MRGRVTVEPVVEDVDVAVGHDHDAHALRNDGDHVALRREVGRVVVHHLVVEDADVVAALYRQIGEIENQDTPGVVGRDVVVNVGAEGVLDLDAGDVVLGAAVAHDDVLALADIDAGIRCAAYGDAFDQHVLR